MLEDEETKIPIQNSNYEVQADVSNNDTTASQNRSQGAMNDGAEDDVSHKLDLNENGFEDATLPLPAAADEGFQCYLKTRKGHFK